MLSTIKIDAKVTWSTPMSQRNDRLNRILESKETGHWLLR